MPAAAMSAARQDRKLALKFTGIRAAAAGVIAGVTDSMALRCAAEPAKPRSQSLRAAVANGAWVSGRLALALMPSSPIQ